MKILLWRKRKTMNKNDAEMLAKAICDEQDRREWDSKLIHSPQEIQRRAKVRDRENEKEIQQILSKMPEKQRNLLDFIFHVVIPIWCLVWLGLLLFNKPLLMFLFFIAVIGVIVYFRQKDVKKWKSKSWHCKNEKCDTAIYDGLIAFFVIILVITEAILLFIFN